MRIGKALGYPASKNLDLGALRLAAGQLGLYNDTSLGMLLVCFASVYTLTKWTGLPEHLRKSVDSPELYE